VHEIAEILIELAIEKSTESLYDTMALEMKNIE
jgi:hypothetical protein